MPTYKYKGRDMHGKAVAGTIALASEKSAREYLRLNDMFVTDLYVSSATEEVKAPFFRRHVKLADLVVFSRQFASMVKAGVPIVQTLESLAEQTESPLLRSALQDIRRDVETGAVFPDGRNGEVRATVSIGLAFYPADAATEAELVSKADEALYRSKRSGKNRVCF